MGRTLLIAFGLALAFASIASGQAVPKHEMTGPQKAEISLYPTAEIQWKDGAASLPAGAKFAVLEGDPQRKVFYNAFLIAGRLQNPASLASEGGACHRHLWHLQCRYGRQI